MNTPLLTWIVVVSSLVLLLIAFIVNHINEKRRMALLHSRHQRAHHNRHSKFITIGSEREEFYCPGDIVKLDSHDWNNQECD